MPHKRLLVVDLLDVDAISSPLLEPLGRKIYGVSDDPVERVP